MGLRYLRDVFDTEYVHEGHNVWYSNRKGVMIVVKRKWLEGTIDDGPLFYIVGVFKMDGENVIGSLEVPELNGYDQYDNPYSLVMKYKRDVPVDVVIKIVERLWFPDRVVTRRESPCRGCGRMNDDGVDSCWWCGCRP